MAESSIREKKKGRTAVLLLVLGVVAAGFGFSIVFPPLRPEISLAAEHLTRQPLWGNVHLTNTMVAMLLVDVVMLGLALIIRKLALQGSDRPAGGFAGVLEAVLDFLYDLTEKTAGKKWVKAIFPFFAIIFFYVLVANWMELVPGVESIGLLEPAPPGEGYVVQPLGFLNLQVVLPDLAVESPGYILRPFVRTLTTDINFTLALAIFSIGMVQVMGFRALGISYFAKFFNVKQLLKSPGRGLIDLAVGFLELISEFSKVISFTFRLFGNVFAGMVIIVVIGTLVPMLPVQSIFLGLELFTGAIQALVFGMLTMVFMSMAMHQHDAEKDTEESLPKVGG